MNSTVFWLTGALTTGVVGSASAEGGCPAGMIPYQGTNTMSCGPMPSASQGTIAGGPRWASRWGAIATDANAGIMGAVNSRESKRRARGDAVSECKSRGGVKCKVTFTYHDQCVVTVLGSQGANHGHAPSIEHAEQLGMNACRAQGDSDCHVYYTACSLSERVH
ncbi:DUF4189 domain-containing protein [Lysobacter sp. CA199]|uniref:DUF4189 domain-containing protein n=1 Tax=Lysobacter sp. CA199 TaxID=3455608 RepID=UPI003F8D8875